ncbi:MAG: 5-oxoprolinase [Deltaproteobacteria bacterium]|nr:5-oxoprolinase [Deltaproteobacteria bacterium]
MITTHVDRGGTFTDVVTFDDDGQVHVSKVRSDEAVVGELSRGDLTFGTTVATNALLERTGVRTALVVTAGLGDLITIGDMSRPAIFDPQATWPKSLASATFEVEGRIDAEGNPVSPLVVPEALVEKLRAFEAVAIVLLHSHRNPSHERALAEALDGHAHVVLGHQSSPELGYLSRIETALVDAAISPLLKAAMKRDKIPARALAIRSDGSLCPAGEFRAPDAVLSGPAGGVRAVEAVARMAGFERAVGLDMGGTSTDVCRVTVGSLPRREGDVRVAGVRLRRPILEVETIAAGGGSILTHDGLRLRVGPASAGADPGPQCYGRGGPPTLTDAALAVGLLNPGAFAPALDVDAVDLPGDPSEFIEVARESMAQAVRKLATARGVDVSDHALVSYGGAAGQHAAAVAERLGIETVLVHPCASVLCAWGQALSPREESRVAALWSPLVSGFERAMQIAQTLLQELPALGEELMSLELRHAGCDHAIEVEAGANLETTRQRFVDAHRERYGFDRADASIEIVNVRARTRAPRPSPPVIDEDPWGLGELKLEGPTRLDSDTTSVVIPEGWTAARERGLLILRCARPAQRALPEARTPFAVELWSNRFMAIAGEAGSVLERLSRSVSIRERLDFSCAIFDGQGQLVANAPHIPVHLGAMGETVRDLIAHGGALEDGQAYLTNDPFAGGSHLPDLTVMTPVEHEGHRFFVACRGHHSDVGGITPGSMPPHATRLDQEGVVWRRLPLLDGGSLVDLSEVLISCRQPDTLRADLEAQIASNAHAARALRALGPAKLTATWMGHLHDVADACTANVIDGLRSGEASDVIDGVPLSMAIRVEADALHVDLTGTGGPHEGNLNAPGAVVRAAILYGIRVLVARDIPLNEGTLRRVQIHIPEPSILSPPPSSAVAGGNVETSQRLVDLFLRAVGAYASSQGTMNNLTLGGSVDGEAWSIYETIGGGQGASQNQDGPSGRQIHMTNTRATDPEVLETRLPLRLTRFSLRERSGGAGIWRGGDGLIREMELLAPGTASLLATRRRRGAPGLEGGRSGEPGRDEIYQDGGWRPWDGRPVELGPGDAVRVQTPGGGAVGATDRS